MWNELLLSAIASFEADPSPVPQASSNPQMMLSLQPTLPQSLRSALFSPSLP